ncbi:putative titin [Sesbania bispinosa]|nr:putative titin [Sesbania bispinosa]
MASDMPTVQPQEVQATQAENIPKHKGRPEKTQNHLGDHKNQVPIREKLQQMRPMRQLMEKLKDLAAAKLVPRKVASGIQIVEPPTCLQQCHYLNQFLHRWFMSAIYG